MPIARSKNENFFKQWSPDMAYVLGFFAADGCMIRNNRDAYFIEFQITDKKLLHMIQVLLESNHKITARRRGGAGKVLYRLQIGSKKIYYDLLKFGFTPHKSKTLRLPLVPEEHFGNFVRGYFDGDGNVWLGFTHKHDRKNPVKILLSCFTSGSKYFLESLRLELKKAALLKGGSLYYRSGAYRLSYSARDSIRLYKFMYSTNNDLCLLRKKSVFEKFLCI